MKANAPEKIYVEIRHPFGNEYTEMLGFEHRGNSDDIEYVRKNAFIEKAHEWPRLNLSNYFDDTREDFELFSDDFRKYLKEE